jgi:hypothetical protein
MSVREGTRSDETLALHRDGDSGWLACCFGRASAQSDECARVRDARRQAENDLMLLLASPLFSDAGWFAAAAQMGINPHYDPHPAANARRQARTQQMQMLIAQISKREQEVCSQPAPRS